MLFVGFFIWPAPPSTDTDADADIGSEVDVDVDADVDVDVPSAAVARRDSNRRWDVGVVTRAWSILMCTASRSNARRPDCRWKSTSLGGRRKGEERSGLGFGFGSRFVFGFGFGFIGTRWAGCFSTYHLRKRTTLDVHKLPLTLLVTYHEDVCFRGSRIRE